VLQRPAYHHDRNDFLELKFPWGIKDETEWFWRLHYRESCENQNNCDWGVPDDRVYSCDPDKPPHGPKP
jgi:hypothetical protein